MWRPHNPHRGSVHPDRSPDAADPSTGEGGLLRRTLGALMVPTGLGVLVDVFQPPLVLLDLVGVRAIGWSSLLGGLAILTAELVRSLSRVLGDDGPTTGRDVGPGVDGRP